MSTLKATMQDFLKDWRADVSTSWVDFLDGIEPAFDDIDPTLTTDATDVVFPGRKGAEPPGAPAGSHVFRAFDGIEPQDVRVVILGQDPYPNVTRATGRSFEQGDLPEWTAKPPGIAASLRRIWQQLASYRAGAPVYTAKGGLQKLRDDVKSGAVDPGKPAEVFDHWQSQGVIMLNAGLTLTRYKMGGHPHQLDGHIPLWAPVVRAICKRLAEDAAAPVVFLCWGSQARAFLAQADILASAKRPVAIEKTLKSVAVVDRDHPAVNAFLSGRNVFEEANDRLTDLGAKPINW